MVRFACSSHYWHIPVGTQHPAPVKQVEKEGGTMRIFSSEPLSSFRSRLRSTLEREDLLDENVYEEVWLPFGDDKETDIHRLVEQHRIRQ